MKKHFTLIVCSFLCSILLISAVNDDGLLEDLLLKIERLKEKFPQEKVHLHFDKPYYSIGDDIWFKAYVVNAEHNELSALSKVLYVDLIDGQDSIRSTTVLPIANGLSSGHIRLSDSLFSAGTYRLRAYTRWMQNFDDDLLFQKQIKIGDALNFDNLLANAEFSSDEEHRLNAVLTYRNLTDKSAKSEKIVSWSFFKGDKTVAKGISVTDEDGKIDIGISYKGNSNDLLLTTSIEVNRAETITRNFPVRNANGQPDLQFFPEGGNMVVGLRSKVAFKAVQPDGTSMAVSGYIVDQNDKKIVDFTSEHAGMGVFAFFPEKEKIYTAILKSKKGLTYEYPLPSVALQGHILSINHSGKDSLIINVKATSPVQTANAVSVMAVQNGNVKYVTRIDNGKSSVSFRLASNRFETGIVQFTMFSSDYKPLAERLLFVNNNDHLKLSLAGIGQTYNKRQKVELELTATDNQSKPVQGSFSVSITNAQHVKYDEDEETTIYSSLLLSSDLRGYIEKPNYYFNKVDASKIRHLDFLMLSQGWRRFKWADIQNDKLPKINYLAQEGLDISGKITSLAGNPIPNGKVVLLGNTSGGPMLIDTVADDQGNFLVRDLVFNGNAKFVARAKNTKGRNNVEILFNNPRELSAPSFSLLPVSSSDDRISDYLQSSKVRFDALVKEGSMKRTIKLNEVKITDKKYTNNKIVKNSFNPHNGFADQVIHKDKLMKAFNLPSAFHGLPGIYVQNNVVYRIDRKGGAVKMMVVANGVEIDAGTLVSIPPSDIEGVEILTSGSNTAIYNSAGVIVLTFIKGGGSRLPSTYLDHINVKGYSDAREFYSPNYDSPDAKTKIPDLRSTVYWSPNLVTQPDGKISFNCFTSDEPGIYRVTIEGMNLNGRLGRQTYTFDVK